MLGVEGPDVKRARIGVQAVAALVVAGTAAYLLTMPRAFPPAAAPHPMPRLAHVARAVSWAHPPGGAPRGGNGIAGLWPASPRFFNRSGGARTVRLSGSGPRTISSSAPPYGNLSLSGPVASYPSPTSPWPSWWLTPIPPTGFPKPGQFGC